MTLKPISYLHTTPVLQRQPGAPPFDPSRPVQRFALAPGTRVYYGFSNNGFVTDIHINPAHADKPNLPGVPVFPAWVPAPTEAVQGSWLGSQPVNPQTLSTREQAEQLSAALTAAGGEQVTIREANFLPWFPIRYGNEPRRMWELHRGGWGANVGQLLAMQFADGVGRPGNWSWTDSGPVWTPQVIPDGSLSAELPHPCRELRSNERFVQQFGGVWMVEIIDTDAPTLENIYAALRRIEARLKS